MYIYEYGACNIEVACFLNSSANERLGMFLDRRRDVEGLTTLLFSFLYLWKPRKNLALIDPVKRRI